MDVARRATESAQTLENWGLGDLSLFLALPLIEHLLCLFNCSMVLLEDRLQDPF